MLIGKTFWKTLAMPNFFYGQELLIYNKENINRLQVIENKAHRFILDIPRSTAIEFLRGEIGSSSMLFRDIRAKIMYLKHALTSNNNDLLKYIATIEIEVYG